ncbi:MAG: hypothetical protein QS748_07430 [Candidatus Endonucleobacter bathymodioli]|uniref:Uncharacterized protein n=1 Tax=Candidatus Endonucleibacter bathymodioli TaxID=539814 RepID=A0AA90SSX5_9GAMM|nr:hypothetical protein [Candidatus Endonucleobacter bathymodioli]
MIFSYRCGKYSKSFLAFLFMLFCSVSWAGIEIIDEGKGFNVKGIDGVEDFSEPWRLIYSLSSSVICKDIRDKYYEGSLTQYQSKPNVVISKVVMAKVENIMENTTMFSIDTDQPIFFVYLESVGASDVWSPMSSLLIFKNNSKKNGCGEITIEIRNSDAEKTITELSVPWVTVKTNEGVLTFDKLERVGTMLYSNRDERRKMHGNNQDNKKAVKRGKPCKVVHYTCDACRGMVDPDAMFYGVEPSVCCCGNMEEIETKLFFSFKVLSMYTWEKT